MRAHIMCILFTMQPSIAEARSLSVRRNLGFSNLVTEHDKASGHKNGALGLAICFLRFLKPAPSKSNATPGR